MVLAFLFLVKVEKDLLFNQHDFPSHSFRGQPPMVGRDDATTWGEDGMDTSPEVGQRAEISSRRRGHTGKDGVNSSRAGAARRHVPWWPVGSVDGGGGVLRLGEIVGVPFSF